MAKPLKETLTDIANAIREKDGKTTLMTSQEMPARIKAIPSGGGVTPKIISGVVAFEDKAGPTDVNIQCELKTSPTNMYIIGNGLESKSVTFPLRANNHTNFNCTFLLSNSSYYIPSELSGQCQMTFTINGKTNYAHLKIGKTDGTIGQEQDFAGYDPRTLTIDFELSETSFIYIYVQDKD